MQDHIKNRNPWIVSRAGGHWFIFLAKQVSRLFCHPGAQRRISGWGGS